MAGLGIYRNYKRIKNEQELLSPALNGSMGVQQPQAQEQPKFTPEDMKRYDDLRKIIADRQTQLSQDKSK
jgi:hypothetical protein